MFNKVDISIPLFKLIGGLYDLGYGAIISITHDNHDSALVVYTDSLGATYGY